MSEFKPFTIQVSTEEQLFNLYHRLNCSAEYLENYCSAEVLSKLNDCYTGTIPTLELFEQIPIEHLTRYNE